MYGFTEYEIVRILEERNDVEYIKYLSKEYEEEYKRIEAENKIRLMHECYLFHCQLMEPIPEEYVDDFLWDWESADMYDRMCNKWCNNCPYISECDIRITERWHNDGELLSNEK